ncbi:MAG: VWA domain-containing protein [Chlorobi bacterium]|nr:VWA domain-containing protein [Chlorobiota bacterium]
MALLLTVGPRLAYAQPLSVEIVEFDTTGFPTIRMAVQLWQDTTLFTSYSGVKFTVSENGRTQILQEMNCPADPDTRLSIALLIDRSGSMAERKVDGAIVNDPDTTKLRAAKAAVAAFVDRMGPSDEAGIFSFAWESGRIRGFSINQDFSKDKVLLKNSLVPISAGGGTWLWQAVLETLKRLDTRQGKKVLIVLTDGKSEKETRSVADVINEALQRKIPVYTVGLGEYVSATNLRAVAAATGGKYYYAKEVDSLSSIYDDIADEVLVDGCRITYVTDEPCWDGIVRNVVVEAFTRQQVIETDTAYHPENRLKPIRFSVADDITVEAGDTIVVPVFCEPVFNNGAFSFDVTLAYNWRLLNFQEVRTSNTRTENHQVQWDVLQPGVVRVYAPARPPAIQTPLLFNLVFDAVFVKDTNSTVLEFTSANYSEECPADVATEDGLIRLEPCITNYVLFTDSLSIKPAGSDLRLPLYLDPPPGNGDPVEIVVTVSYNSQLLRFTGFDETESVAAEISANVFPSGDGMVTIQMKGFLRGDRKLLGTLLFSVVDVPDSRVAIVTVENASVNTKCITTVQAHPLAVFIDGQCRKIASRRRAAFLSARPNPFNEQTLVHFVVPVDGRVRLRSITLSGVRVATYRDGWMRAGEYALPVAFDGISSGTFYLVLETGAGVDVKKIVMVK